MLALRRGRSVEKPTEQVGMSGVALSETEPLAHSSPNAWRVEVGLVLILGLIAMGFRIVELDRPGVWFDESSSCRWIDFSFLELLERTAEDCHPPLYWILLGLWRHVFGGGVGVLRAMSVMFGVATVVAAYGMVRTLPILDERRKPSTHRTDAILAALLIALSPFHIEWSQEMRMYSLATFEAVLATWLFAIGLRGGRGATAAWAGYAIVGTASLYTMYFSGFILAAHGLFTIARGIVTGRWPFGFFAAAVGVWIAFSPWLPAVISMVGTVQKSFPQGPLTWASFSTIFWRMFVPPNFSAPDDLKTLTLILLCGAVVVALLFGGTPQRRLIGLCALIPFQVILSVSLASQNLVGRHRLILGQMFLLVGWAMLIGGIRRPLPRWALAVVSIQASLWTALYYLDMRLARAELPGMRAAMSELDAVRKPQEPVFFVNPMLYLNGIAYSPHLENVFSAGRHEHFPYYQGASLTRESDYSELSTIPEDVQLVWVVDADNWFGRSWRLPLPRQWTLIAETEYVEYYATVVVRKYRRDPSP